MTTALTTAGATPSSDELYNRLCRVLLQETNLPARTLPADAQATITFLAFGADETVVAGFGRLLELTADSAYERGWMAHEMFVRHLASAAAAPPVGPERLTVVEGGQAS